MVSQMTTKCVYKPDSMSTDEFIIIISDESAAKKWIDGDTTIPLVEFVDSFDVFHTGQGSQGLLERPSKQQLESVFETGKDVDIVQHILKHGKMIQSKGVDGHKQGDKTTSGLQTSRGAVHGGR